MRNTLNILLFIAALALCSCGQKEKAHEYLLVKFEGDNNWSLIDAKLNVVARDVLCSANEPSLIKEGIFIADSGYYSVNDLRAPIFTEYASGTLFEDGKAIAVTANGEFYAINKKGKICSPALDAHDRVWGFNGELFYTHDQERGKRVIGLASGSTMPNNKGCIIAPDLIATRKQTKEGNRYTCYKTSSNGKAAEKWSTNKNILNIEQCYEMGYIVERTTNGRIKVFDLAMNELFSNDSAFIDAGHYTTWNKELHDICFNDRVIFRNREGAMGVMKRDGTTLIQPVFSKIIHMGKNVYLVTDADGTYLMKENGIIILDNRIVATMPCPTPMLGNHYVVKCRSKKGGHEFVFVTAEGEIAYLPARVTEIGNRRIEADAKNRINCFKKRI